ncbi:hypothetical protein CH380_00775 [Leptospira adleri]|uniref:Uncharacterized protein n=1 Tax=Leptospira adleri TaxID=2023186 RepID=A0A2M9YU71_9LEPT|nr:hypothetical protein CH380_00775 [Leptospira adleri]PJZ63790.1 hypothetical protein CH376_01330 [Leptospira adleri]
MNRTSAYHKKRILPNTILFRLLCRKNHSCFLNHYFDLLYLLRQNIIEKKPLEIETSSYCQNDLRSIPFCFIWGFIFLSILRWNLGSIP